MADLPAGITYGRVYGQILRAVIDGPDAGSQPDSNPATGSITFTPAVQGTVAFAGIPAVVVIPDPVTFVLDASGSFDGYLVATDQGNPINWVYIVSFTIPNVTIPSFNVAIPGGSSNPIDSFLPVGISNGVLTVRGPQGPPGSGGGGGTPDDNSVSTVKIQDGAVTLAKHAANSVDSSKIVDGSIVAADLNTALKPSGTATAGTEALRALGTTSSTAAAGNDGRLSDPRNPLSHGATHQAGGTDAIPVTTTTATLGADVAVAAATLTDIVSISLPVGTYLVTAEMLVAGSANLTNFDMVLVAGTASASFGGGAVASGSISTTALYQTVSVTCFVTVTAAGTIKMQTQSAPSKTLTVKYQSQILGVSGVTGITALRLM